MFALKITKKLKSCIRKVEGYYLSKKGFLPERYFPLKREMKKEFHESTLPRSQKRWASKRGFYTFRIPQYGLTEENYRNVISDWDYEYLYPMNCKYQSWIENKLTMRYTLAPFSSILPKYYFHILKSRGIMRLMDCPEEWASSVEGVMQCIRFYHTIAAKHARGSHGKGFYKIEASGDGFLVNGLFYSEESFQEFICGLDDYILTEYIVMHPLFEEMNPNSVNTIRMTVINEHGNDPIIPFAFLRIGTKKSGFTDNLGSGGMACKIDVDSGVYYGAETLINHVYTRVDCHPDTKVKLEGTIPHWESVKKGIFEICKYMPELEWLGFDVAITKDDFCIVEINRSQNLQKAYEYPDVIKSYLFRKLREKKEKYHIK